MEPLSSQTRIKADFTLSLLYFLVIWVPLIYAFISLSFSFSFESLNSSFFYLLTKSTFFALTQASLSVFIIAAASFLIGYFKTTSHLNFFAYRLLSFTSFFLFSISPTLLALSLLNFSSLLKSSHAQGLIWILICHFMINGLFIAHLFMKKIDRYESSQTEDLKLFLRSLGSNRFHYIKFYFWPLFKNDFFSWAPQVFFWCFNSFSPVLLLTENTQQTTPEILFYYSILNDRGGGRIFCIFLLNLILGFFLNRFFDKSFYLQEAYIDKKQEKKTYKRNSFSLFIFFVSILFLVPPMSSFFQFFRQFSIQSSLIFSNELWISFFTSIAIAVFSFIFSFVVGFLCLIAKQNSLIIKYSNILSPPFILLGWLEVGFYSSNTFISVFIISLASFLSVFPWFYRQIKSQRDQFPKDWGYYCLTLGMTPLNFAKGVLYPLHKETLINLACVSSLWAFGEYAFSKVFFEKNQSLPLFIDENLRRYNFDASSLGILLSFLGSFLLIFIMFKNERDASC